MKKIISFIFVLTMLFWLVRPYNTNQELFIDIAGCACDAEGSGLAYNFGKYKGQCIDNCLFKSISSQTHDKDLIISNVQTLSGHSTLTYRIDEIDSVYILFDRFAPKLNHVALIFMFTPREGAIQGLVLSPEAIPPQQKDYSLTDGLLSNYAINYQAYSIEKYIENSIALHYPLRKYRLNLSAIHQKNLFINSVKQAADQSFNTAYHLLSRNCATTVLDLILDSKEEKPTMARIVWNLFDPLRGMPFEWVGTKRSLTWWDLIEPHAQWLHRPKVGALTPTQ